MASRGSICWVIVTVTVLVTLLAPAIGLASEEASTSLEPGTAAFPDPAMGSQPVDAGPICGEGIGLDLPLSAGDQGLLELVRESVQFKTLLGRLTAMEPVASWRAEGFTWFAFDLQPGPQTREVALTLHPTAFFALDEKSLVLAMVSTPDLAALQVEVQEIGSSQPARRVDMSEAVVQELQQAMAVKEVQQPGPEPSQPEGPCQYFCTQSVYHPGHISGGCYTPCATLCGFISNRPAKAACLGACVAACWVPPWTECLRWEYVCGLP